MNLFKSKQEDDENILETLTFMGSPNQEEAKKMQKWNGQGDRKKNRRKSQGPRKDRNSGRKQTPVQILLKSGRKRNEKRFDIKSSLRIMVQGVVRQRRDWVGLEVDWRWGSTFITHNFIKYGNEERRQIEKSLEWKEEQFCFFSFFFSGGRRINDVFRCKGVNSLKTVHPDSNWWHKTPKKLEETGLKVQLKFSSLRRYCYSSTQQRNTEEKTLRGEGQRKVGCVYML